jgi:hypothetical protein
MRRLVSRWHSIFNLGHLEVRHDPDYPDRYLLETSEGAAFPELLCWSMQGFYNRMAAEHDCPDLWRLDHPRQRPVRHRMTRPV